MPKNQHVGLCGHKKAQWDTHSKCLKCAGCTPIDRCDSCYNWAAEVWVQAVSRRTYKSRKERKRRSKSGSLSRCSDSSRESPDFSAGYHATPPGVVGFEFATSSCISSASHVVPPVTGLPVSPGTGLPVITPVSGHTDPPGTGLPVITPVTSHTGLNIAPAITGSPVIPVTGHTGLPALPVITLTGHNDHNGPPVTGTPVTGPPATVPPGTASAFTGNDGKLRRTVINQNIPVSGPTGLPADNVGVGGGHFPPVMTAQNTGQNQFDLATTLNALHGTVPTDMQQLQAYMLALTQHKPRGLSPHKRHKNRGRYSSSSSSGDRHRRRYRRSRSRSRSHSRRPKHDRHRSRDRYSRRPKSRSRSRRPYTRGSSSSSSSSESERSRSREFRKPPPVSVPGKSAPPASLPRPILPIPRSLSIISDNQKRDSSGIQVTSSLPSFPLMSSRVRLPASATPSNPHTMWRRHTDGTLILSPRDEQLPSREGSPTISIGVNPDDPLIREGRSVDNRLNVDKGDHVSIVSDNSVKHQHKEPPMEDPNDFSDTEVASEPYLASLNSVFQGMFDTLDEDLCPIPPQSSLSEAITATERLARRHEPDRATPGSRHDLRLPIGSTINHAFASLETHNKPTSNFWTAPPAESKATEASKSYRPPVPDQLSGLDLSKIPPLDSDYTKLKVYKPAPSSHVPIPYSVLEN